MENNMIKYENYRHQMIRLKKAIANQFYLEAVFIEYAIIEDRTESILNYTDDLPKGKGANPPGLQQKLNKIKKLAENKKSITRKYFNDELIDRIDVWKDMRNGMIHALMKHTNSTAEFKEIAEEGNRIVADLCRIGRNYKNALVRAEKKNQEGTK